MQKVENKIPIFEKRTLLEKIETIIGVILALIILILAILDAVDKFNSIYIYEPIFVILMIDIFMLYIKYDKRKAFLFIGCGILILISYILILVI